jgi:hypothetical protein
LLQFSIRNLLCFVFSNASSVFDDCKRLIHFKNSSLHSLVTKYITYLLSLFMIFQKLFYQNILEFIPFCRLEFIAAWVTMPKSIFHNAIELFE